MSGLSQWGVGGGGTLPPPVGAAAREPERAEHTEQLLFLKAALSAFTTQLSDRDRFERSLPLAALEQWDRGFRAATGSEKAFGSGLMPRRAAAALAISKTVKGVTASSVAGVRDAFPADSTTAAQASAASSGPKKNPAPAAAAPAAATAAAAAGISDGAAASAASAPSSAPSSRSPPASLLPVLPGIAGSDGSNRSPPKSVAPVSRKAIHAILKTLRAKKWP